MGPVAIAMFSAGEGEGMCGISTPLTHNSQQRVRRPLELALVRSQGCPGWVVEAFPDLGVTRRQLCVIYLENGGVPRP